MRKLLLFLVLFSTGALQAQLPGDISRWGAGKLKSYGEDAMNVGDWYSAVTYLEEYVQKKPKDALGMMRLGDAHRASRNYLGAEAAYLKAYETDKEKALKALLYHGLMQIRNGKCDEAIENFGTFRKKYRDFDDVKQVRKTIRIATEGCDLSKVLMDSIDNWVEITALEASINQAHIEFAPRPQGDSVLVYSSLKADESRFYELGKPMPVRQLYTATKRGDNWQHDAEMPTSINDPNLDTGNGAFSPDGEHFYFTRCTENYEGKKICHIYKSDLVNGEWKEAIKLDENVNDPRYSSTMPSVGIESFRNREVLYFVSDRPEGKGGLDIWYCVLNSKTKTYYEPKNAGFRVNSSGDDITPYYDFPTNTMYFSTNARPGMGGMDVFKTTGEKSKWEDAVNVGYPINTPADELYYILNEDGETGFFTSNRSGSQTFSHPTCCDDIYAFKPAPPPPPEEEKEDSIPKPVEPEVVTIYLKGQIVEETEDGQLTTTPIANAIVALYKLEPDGSKEFVRNFYTKSKGEFTFKVEGGDVYELAVSRENFFSKTETLTIPEVEEDVNKKIGLQPITQKGIVIKNIYYEFDKADLTPEAMATIDTSLLILLKNNPALIVEISAHTDSKGNDIYNQKLSQRRAESVVKYLVLKGLDKNRLRAKGYGETNPIAPNANSDGSDNPEGRQKNRRTEFKVIGTLDVEVEYKE